MAVARTAEDATISAISCVDGLEIRARTRVVCAARTLIMVAAVVLGALVICFIETQIVVERDLVDAIDDACQPGENCWKHSLSRTPTARYKVQKTSARWDSFELTCDFKATPGGNCAAMVAAGASLVAYGSCAMQPFSRAHMLFSSSSLLAVVLPDALLRMLTLNAYNYKPLVFVSFCFDFEHALTRQTYGTAGKTASEIDIPVNVQAALAERLLIDAGAGEIYIWLEIYDGVRQERFLNDHGRPWRSPLDGYASNLGGPSGPWGGFYAPNGVWQSQATNRVKRVKCFWMGGGASRTDLGIDGVLARYEAADPFGLLSGQKCTWRDANATELYFRSVCAAPFLGYSDRLFFVPPKLVVNDTLGPIFLGRLHARQGEAWRFLVYSCVLAAFLAAAAVLLVIVSSTQGRALRLSVAEMPAAFPAVARAADASGRSVPDMVRRSTTAFMLLECFLDGDLADCFTDLRLGVIGALLQAAYVLALAAPCALITLFYARNAKHLTRGGPEAAPFAAATSGPEPHT